jgi:Predicted Zn-dependent protease (DUF2268)
MKKLILIIVVGLTLTKAILAQSPVFSSDPEGAIFHTEDIAVFWKVFDETSPKFEAQIFQEKYINVGSKGLMGFIKMRIENGKNLSKTIKSNLSYYQAIRESSLSMDKGKERIYECFRNMKKIYPQAVFPDVYFVIGAMNSGGTTFDGGLIMGAEMFGEPSENFKPRIDVGVLHKIVAHESVHFQQKYGADRSLLAQCVREGSADFIAELISGEPAGGEGYAYGNAHSKELWDEFVSRKDGTSWKNWLYYQKDKSRPNDLGYWMGYKITKAYYNKAVDKMAAIKDILNIQDFNKFLKDSGYNGE